MFRNSIKELGEPSPETVALPRRDSLTLLGQTIVIASADGSVSRPKSVVITKTFFSFVLISLFY